MSRRIELATARLDRIRTRPRILAYWLKSARSAQLLLGFGLLGLLLLLPPLLSALTEWLVPGENLLDNIGGVFGGESQSDRARSLFAGSLTAATWLTLICTVIYKLWRNIPHAHRQSRRIAQAQEQAADSSKPTDPARSLQLYRSARGMTLEPVMEARLEAKIQQLEGHRDASEADEKATTYIEPEQLVIAGRYECRSEIGRGGNGIVHLAFDRVLDRELALKELPVAHAFRNDTTARFRQEAQALARLNHSGIIQIHDLLEADGRLWIVMELVRGGDLDALLQREGALPVPHACRLAERMADALASAHEQGVVHRDLKPLNVLMVDRHTPKITDFGLAKLSEGPAHTLEGIVVGSPHYMSPEQCEGVAIDHRSDIYSLGVMLYEMLAGRVPFSGEARTILAQHLQKTPPPLDRGGLGEKIPAPLHSLMLGMLEKRPEDRPQDMLTIHETLADFSLAPSA